jgi:hypothetical protein
MDREENLEKLATLATNNMANHRVEHDQKRLCACLMAMKANFGFEQIARNASGQATSASILHSQATSAIKDARL